MRLHADFRGADEVALRDAVSYNLCLKEAETFGACAWKKNQKFAKTEEVIVRGVAVPPGDWYVRVNGDRMRRVSADVYVADDGAAVNGTGARVASLAPCVVDGKLIGGPQVMPLAEGRRRRLLAAPSPPPPIPPKAASHFLFFDVQLVNQTLANFNDSVANPNNTFAGNASSLLAVIKASVNTAGGDGESNIWLEKEVAIDPSGGVKLRYGAYFSPSWGIPTGFENNLLDAVKLTALFKASSEKAGFGNTVGEVVAKDITRRYYGTQPSPPPPSPPPLPLYPPGGAPPSPSTPSAPPLPANVTSSAAGAALLEPYLGDYDDDYVSPPAVVDSAKPWIKIFGSVDVVVHTGARFADPGAMAADMHDGAIPTSKITVTARDAHGVVVPVKTGIDTSKPTPTGAPYTIAYDVKDKAGNAAATVTRTVAVVDPCSANVTTTGVTESTCPGSLVEGVFARVCSVGGKCPDAAQLTRAATEAFPPAGAAPLPDVFEPTPDVNPPVITLLGGAPATTLAGGVVVDSVVVNVGAVFVDPGATAWDPEDGDVTHRISAFGVGNVDTTAVTAKGLPYLIEYGATDAAGNAATVARRRVTVVNSCEDAPRGPLNLAETLCEDGTCSVGGVCPVVVLSIDQLAAKPKMRAKQPPSLKLVGPAAMQVPVGSPYSACPGDGTVGTPGTPCDPGAVATDAEDGDLTPLVTACAPWGVFTRRFDRAGVSGCNIDTSVPGKHTVWFRVADSSRRVVTANRTVLVVPSCNGGERVCPGTFNCSTGMGYCPDAGADADALAAAMGGYAGDTPPTLTLAGPETVYLRRFANYGACRPSRAASEAQTLAAARLGLVVPANGTEEAAYEASVCDPGVALALDAAGGNLTDRRVLACPPAHCLASGCPGHELSVKGVAGCVDPTAPGGTMFDVAFVAVDYAGRTTTARRRVIIASRCAAGKYDCGHASGCSDVPCATLQALLAPPTGSTGEAATAGIDPGAPVLSLVGGGAVVDVAYAGANAEKNDAYAPCASAAKPTAGCGAVATDAVPGSGNTPSDLSARIVVREVSSGVDGLICDGALAAAGGCAPCGLAAAAAGACVPGVYVYEYSVSDDDGKTAVARRTIRVSAFARVGGSLQFTFAGALGTALTFPDEPSALAHAEATYTNAFVAAKLEAVRGSVEVRVPITAERVNVTRRTVLGVAPYTKCAVEFTVDAGTYSPVRRIVASPPPLTQPPAVVLPSGVKLEFVSPPPSAPSPPPPPPSPPPAGKRRILHRNLLGVIANDETGPILDAAAAKMQSMVTSLGGSLVGAPVAITPVVDQVSATRAGIEAALESVARSHAVLRARLEEVRLNFERIAASAASNVAVDRLAKAEAGFLAISDSLASLRDVSAPYSAAAGRYLALELPRLEEVRAALLANRVEMIARVEALAAAAAAARQSAERGACKAAVAFATSTSGGGAAVDGSGRAVPPAKAHGVLSVEYRVPFGVAAATQPMSEGEREKARAAAAARGVTLDTGSNSILRVLSREASELSSFVGGGSQNKIVGGVTLFLARKTHVEGGCGGGKFAKLDAPCYPDGFVSAPYGVDPVASPFHAMFDADVAAELGAFYDVNGTADAKPELVNKPGTKVPHAFYSRSVPGFVPGYFAYFDTALPLTRVAGTLLRVLKDGRFMHSDTVDHLRMMVVTWNSELEVFGNVEVTFSRDETGSFEASTKVNVLADYRASRPDVATGIAGQAIMLAVVLGFLINTVLEIRAYAARTKNADQTDTDENETDRLLRLGKYFRGMLLYYGRDRWRVVDTLVDVMVIVTQIMWWVYVGVMVLPLSEHAAVTSTLPVYDNDAAAEANVFLPTKTYAAGSVAANTTFGARWSASDDPNANGLRDLTSFAREIDRAIEYRFAYLIVQVVVIIILWVRFVALLSFHPQIGAISNTLIRAFPFLLEFAFLWIGAIYCFSVMANLQLGWWFDECRTLGSAMNWVFRVMVSGFNGDQVILNDKSRALSSSEYWGKMILVNAFLIYMSFILVNFILSVVLTQYAEIAKVTRKRIANGGRTTSKDIRDGVSWLHAWCRDRYTGEHKSESAKTKLQYEDLMKILKPDHLTVAEVKEVEHFLHMKEDFAKNVDHLLKPLVETPKEREARCRQMRLTLGGVVYTFDDLLALCNKTALDAELLEEERVKDLEAEKEAKRARGKTEEDDEKHEKPPETCSEATKKALKALKAAMDRVDHHGSEVVVDDPPFVPANPVDPKDIAIHVMDTIGWYPEAQKDDTRSLALKMGEERAMLQDVRPRVTQVEVNVGTLRGLTEQAEKLEKQAELLSGKVIEFKQYRERKKAHYELKKQISTEEADAKSEASAGPSGRDARSDASSKGKKNKKKK